MKYIFIIMLILSIAAPFVLDYSYSGVRTKKKRIAAKASTAVMLVLIAGGILDVFAQVNNSPVYGSFALISVFEAIQFALIALNYKNNFKTVGFARKAILAAFILELVVFQIPSYPTLFNGKYEEKNIAPQSVSCTAPDGTVVPTADGVNINGNSEVIFVLNNIDVPVKSIQLEADMAPNTDYVYVYFDISDETASNLRTNIATGKLVRGADFSEYIQLNMSGKVSRMQVRVVGTDAASSFKLTNFRINAPIPFDVYPLRFTLISVLAVLAYAIVNSSVLGKETMASKRVFKAALAVLTVFALFISWKVADMKLPDGGWKAQMTLETGDQMTKELVDAFADGKLELDIDVDPKLEALDNPYDWGARDGIGYAWDHLFVDGKYYSYYGIAPVVLFFLPYHRITGHYFSVNLAVLLFCMVGIVFLTLTFYEFIKRFFPKIPLGCSVAGYIVMLMTCGVWYNVYWALFYMTAISSGFMFLTAGAYFLVSSGIFQNEKISLVRTALSSLFIGLAVLSRPTLAVYAICAYVIYALNLKRSMCTDDGKTDKSRRVKYALSGGLPLALLGIAQMAYNFARFGNPLDFGIKYSLTINDFINSEFHLVFMMLGAFTYLIAPPIFRSTYPFVSTEFNLFDVNGYYYRCPETVSGIIFMALPVIGYVFSAKVLRRLPDKKSRLNAVLSVGLPCLVMPIVIICSVWESGYAIRYIADFAWEMVIGALAVLFWLYTRSKNETKKKQFRQFMALSVVAAVVMNCPQIFYYWFSTNEFPELCAEFTNMIAFWR